MIRILVVEDDPEMRELIAITLDDPELEVAGEAASGEDALALVSDLAPDVVILDHFLAGRLTGLQLAPAIGALVPDTRILLFSSHDLTAEVAHEPSVHGYLRKAHSARLPEAVRELLDVG
jgi:DNA-binding NarL/FixJ family response regulator